MTSPADTAGPNFKEYEKSGVARRLKEPTKADLIEFLKADIEAWSDGLSIGLWEIHCAATLLKKLEGGAL